MMNVAIVHDWLVTNAGAEKVLSALIELFPNADLFSIVEFLDEPSKKEFLQDIHVTTSFIQHLPFSKKHFRKYLPLFPQAVASFDLRKYDLILSSSWAFAKGIKKDENQIHICYCHTPIRYVWDLKEEYFRNIPSPFYPLAQIAAKYLQQWDIQTSKSVDHFIANSHFVKKRIQNIYNRDATVIYPPVDTTSFTLCKEKEDYYVTMSRLVPYKRVDLIIQAFAKNGERLIVIGDGEERKRLEAMATKNIEFRGWIQKAKVIATLQKAKGFVYAAIEDFGIAPVEAQACGTPVIALGMGGTAESVIDGITGVHFHKQSIEALQEAVEHFESIYDTFDFATIAKHAKSFSKERFLHEMQTFIKEKAYH